MKTFASLLAIAAIALAAPPAYKIADKIKVGGEGGWDYVYVDSAAQRLYASHATKAIVIDLAAGKVVGEIADTQGIHGIAIAPDLGRGFTSNGRENTVTIFDSKTLKVISKVMVPGKNPDSIIYEPVSKRIFTFNGGSKDATSIDAKSGMVLATFPMDGKPEFAQADGKGRIYVNNEDKAEIYEIDAQKNSGAEALFDCALRSAQRPGARRRQAPALLGLRKQADDHLQSRYRQGAGHAADRRGRGRGGL